MTDQALARRGATGALERFADLPVYGLPDEHKRQLLLDTLHQLTLHHVEHCADYRNLLGATGVDPRRAPEDLADLPPVTVRQFKGRPFRSIPESAVAATLRSSGTGGRPSTIHLDRDAAAAQSRTLARIMQEWLGPKRLPMLIADHRSVAGRQGSHSARGAGIQGMAMLGRRHTYALADDLSLDTDAIEKFVAEATDGPILVYGFTFVVWKHVLPALIERGVNLPDAILVHGGGWKRLEAEAVDRTTFQARAAEAGIERVHDYYGMVEQTGAIFVECENGHLHAPVHADVMVRDPATLRPLPPGDVGLIQVMSVLPTSYPGHVLLTEDVGRILGTDDCPCGRLGRHFEVHGRLPRAEARGCSDAFASSATAGVDLTADGPEGSEGSDRPGDGLVHLLGAPIERVVRQTPTDPFDPDSVAFLRCLAAELRSTAVARTHPSLAALGFWLRDANLDRLREHFESGARRRVAAGAVLHLTPGNVDLLFAYTWTLSLLVGNADVIRLSRRPSDERSALIEILRRLLADPNHAAITDRLALVTYDHDDGITERLSNLVTRRVIWGSDATVTHLRSIPAAPAARDLVFPNRRSAAIISAAAVIDADSLDPLVERFHRDAYGFEQKACASPSLVVWRPDTEDTGTARRRFWSALAAHLARRGDQLPPATLMDRLVAVQAHARRGGMRLREDSVTDHRLVVVEVDGPTVDRPAEHPGGGLFFETVLRREADIGDWITSDLQTLTCVGLDPTAIDDLISRTGARRPDRVVAGGSALDFDVVWDGMDLFEQLSRTVSAVDIHR